MNSILWAMEHPKLELADLVPKLFFYTGGNK